MGQTVQYSYAYVNSKTGLATKIQTVGLTAVSNGPRPVLSKTSDFSIQLHLFDTPDCHPWTWGFYCDDCERFFDLVTEGWVGAYPNGTCGRYHDCGRLARYISYKVSKY
jgi:hypothetical protein